MSASGSSRSRSPITSTSKESNKKTNSPSTGSKGRNLRKNEELKINNAQAKQLAEQICNSLLRESRISWENGQNHFNQCCEHYYDFTMSQTWSKSKSAVRYDKLKAEWKTTKINLLIAENSIKMQKTRSEYNKALAEYGRIKKPFSQADNNISAMIRKIVESNEFRKSKHVSITTADKEISIEDCKNLICAADPVTTDQKDGILISIQITRPVPDETAKHQLEQAKRKKESLGTQLQQVVQLRRAAKEKEVEMNELLKTFCLSAKDRSTVESYYEAQSNMKSALVNTINAVELLLKHYLMKHNVTLVLANFKDEEANLWSSGHQKWSELNSGKIHTRNLKDLIHEYKRLTNPASSHENEESDDDTHIELQAILKEDIEEEKDEKLNVHKLFWRELDNAVELRNHCTHFIFDPHFLFHNNYESVIQIAFFYLLHESSPYQAGDEAIKHSILRKIQPAAPKNSIRHFIKDTTLFNEHSAFYHMNGLERSTGKCSSTDCGEKTKFKMNKVGGYFWCTACGKILKN